MHRRMLGLLDYDLDAIECTKSKKVESETSLTLFNVLVNQLIMVFLGICTSVLSFHIKS